MKSTLIAILFSLGVAMSQDMQDSIVTRHDNVWIAEQPGLDDLDAWAAAGAKAAVEIIPGAPHAFDMFETEDAARARTSAAAFLQALA